MKSINQENAQLRVRIAELEALLTKIQLSNLMDENDRLRTTVNKKQFGDLERDDEWQ